MWTEARTKTKMKKAVELPFSLIESEILPRVAAKSDIGRCRCVCKQWKSVLSTPTFGRMHLQRHGTTINDYKLLLFDAQSPFLLRTLSHPTPIPSNPNSYRYADLYPQVCILASLDGLVCLASREVRNRLVFWNPLTGAYRKVWFRPGFMDFCYAINDIVGFYKDSSKDYKLLYLKTGGRLGAYVYSHRFGTCWQIGFDYPTGRVVTWSPATFWGQCLYFTVHAYMSNQIHWWIICFDVETETFRKICFPPSLVLDDEDDDTLQYCESLVVLNGCLHLCVSYTIFINRICSKQCNLWRMDGDDGWVKVADFCDQLDDKFTTQRICTASTGNWLAVVDEEKKSFKKVNSEDFRLHYRHFSFPSFGYTSSRMIYVETLVSPDP